MEAAERVSYTSSGEWTLELAGSPAETNGPGRPRTPAKAPKALIDKLLSEPSDRRLKEADVLGDAEIAELLDSINQRIRGDQGTTANQRLRKRVVALIERDSSLSRFVKRRRGWACQICGANPVTIFNTQSGPPYVEAHHIGWLSRGGPDVEANVVIVCATCHRKLHHAPDTQLKIHRNRRDLVGKLDGKRIVIRNYRMLQA